MASPNQITIHERVRYPECDPMGFVHHSVYPIWFEMARTELLRQTGVSYAQMEERDLLIVVVKLEVKYHQPARYDDDLKITATLTQATGARIEHDYLVERDGVRLVTGKTTLACLNRAGRIQPVPDYIRQDG